MWQSVLSIADKLVGWFTPEQSEKRVKRKIISLEKEINALSKKQATDRNSTRMANLLRKLSELRKKVAV